MNPCSWVLNWDKPEPDFLPGKCRYFGGLVEEAWGLYLHIPFCLRKCDYCSFYSTTDLSRIDAYVSALVVELTMKGSGKFRVDTIHFGGGTPSVLRKRHVETLLETIAGCFQLTPDPEITMELNPGTVTNSRMKTYYRAGINRVSIGVQSFQDMLLRKLGRIHTARQAREVIRDARNAGFENLGIDLISGVPGQDLDSWLRDMETAVNFGPEHLSCYQLSLENGTPLYQRVREGIDLPVDDDTAAELFRATLVYLTENDYQQYEISNYCLHGNKPSRHNLKYWNLVPYCGAGPSAHSFDGCDRFWNSASLRRYLQAVQNGCSPESGRETLSGEQILMERIYLGLRTARGIPVKDIEAECKLDFTKTFGDVLTILQQRGLIVFESGCYRLTPEGMLLADSVIDMLTSVT